MGLRVRIDKCPSIPWPQRESLKIEQLDVKERHLLAMVGACGKPIASLWVRLSDDKSTQLYLASNGYQASDYKKDDKLAPWCKRTWNALISLESSSYLVVASDHSCSARC
jgi:hypothetical protein